MVKRIQGPLAGCRVIRQLDDIQIVHALRATRERTEQFIATNHYTRLPGIRGCFTYAAVRPDGEILGTVAIGQGSSTDAIHNLFPRPPVPNIWTLRRMVCLDSCPVPESQLLRAAMNDLAQQLQYPLIVISYADPLAVDIRPGRERRPLLGGVYLAAGYFGLGFTVTRRTHVPVDQNGAVHGTRFGDETLSRNNLPDGWVWQRIPDGAESRFLIYCGVAMPHALLGGPRPRGAGQRYGERWWGQIWGALAPDRRVAARQWTLTHEAEVLERLGRAQLLEPIDERTPKRGDRSLARGLWEGALLRRDAGPAWWPVLTQHAMFSEADLLGETTAQRQHLALALAAPAEAPALFS